MKLLKIVICLFIFSIPTHSVAQEPSIDYVKAKIVDVYDERIKLYPVQQVEAEIISVQKEKTVHFSNTVINNRDDLRLNVGEKVILQKLIRPDGSVDYFFQEKYRLPAILILCILFFIVGAIIGRKRGVMSILGLIVSIAIIFFVFFPLILKGWNPLLVIAIGSVFVAGATILISHGLYKRTYIALISTYITLLCAILLAMFSVSFARIFGLGSDESAFLLFDAPIQIDLKGLFLGGIIIGALGVLDDITTTQVAAVEEISKANPSYKFKQLYSAGFSVGYEHIASMINTLALAYIGASLPLFLLFFLSEDMPVWVIVNSAFLSEEIIRTLVGSTALLLAAPISTWIAARYYE